MITLVLGGVRSGKSDVAERIASEAAAATGDRVTYIATGAGPDTDPAAAERVAAHRARRPQWWDTIEEEHALAKVLATSNGVALVESLGTWLAHDVDGAPFDELLDTLTVRRGDVVLVSEEVGLGVHPPTEIGRRFADRLGELNRRVADIADRVVVVAAGRAVELPPAPHEPAAPATADEFSGGRFANLRAAASFLTVAGGNTAPSRRALEWFPLVGAGLGLALGFVWSAAAALFTPLLGAVVAVAADAALTGGLHLDGLADSADALLPPLSRARRLAVLHDPHIGAFGATTLTLVLAARVAALASFTTARPFLLAAVWCASRTAMAATVRSVPYARRAGLAAAFTGGGAAAVAVAGFAGAALLAAVDGGRALVAVGVVVAVSAAAQWFAVRRIGGFTGDTVGAAGVAGETMALIVAAALA